MARDRSNDEKEIPLFLIPRIIATQIKKTGDRIYRISVKRTHWHHYNVSVRTKALPKELAPGRAAVVSRGMEIISGKRGIAPGDGSA